jgi:hypothetical protein
LDQLLDQARQLELNELITDASNTAKPFSQRRGFSILHQQRVLRRGVWLMNDRMRLPIQQAADAATSAGEGDAWPRRRSRT